MQQAADDRQEVDNVTQAPRRRGHLTKVDPGPIVSIQFGWMVCYIPFVQLISANICFRLCQKPIHNLLNQCWKVLWKVLRSA